MNFDIVKNYLIEEAEKAGLDEYEIFIEEGTELSTGTLKGEISSFTSRTAGGVGFRCIVDGQMGIANTQLFTKEEMGELVSRAIENAKNLESTDKPFIYKGSKEYQRLEAEPLPTASAAELKKAAVELYQSLCEGCEYIADGTETGTMVYSNKTALINSHGLCLESEMGNVGAYAQPVIQKDGESQYGFEMAEGLSGEGYDTLTQRSIDDAVSKVGACEIPSGKYDVIFDGKQMKALLGAYSSVFSGRQANLGLSLLRGKEGEKIAADCLSLIDDPMYKESRMKTAFDGEGVAAYKKNVIEGGVLKTLLYDLASAEKAGKTTTANAHRSYDSPVYIAPYHFYIDKGEYSEEELLAHMGDGIYITELKGLHAGANSVTGDFSIESFGFRVRDGKKCEAVKSFTIAGNFFELLRSVEALSDKVKFGFDGGITNIGSPDVLVRNMSIAGT